MTSAEIRQSFLDFFAKQGHTIVPSASLLPDSPGLLFTNAGMNPFVPIFLGDRKPDVSTWAGARPGRDTRAADTQKCIRAGGKHNDLEDVGYDTYHHTLFEMLGNWSFGDYFKKESLTWGWELLTRVWGIPPKRLFATVYSPDKARGDPADFDQEAHDIWTGIFKAAGLDPAVHIVNGSKKDNFWMMGDTGPCGPCSEIHFNLLPSDDEQAGRALVNSSSSRCIEIWNHVFIQFNANADGTFSPLAARHVDTGMGFERVAGIHATTKGFKDFSAEPSNYEADIFTELFDCVEKLSGRRYAGTVPAKREGLSAQEQTDVAFRVLADHARCVSCAIADGILPGNEGRNYVIRRILRRGILYGKKLGLGTGFFEQLVAPVVASLGPVFPELVQQQDIIRRVIRSEEESFGRTLDRGLDLFRQRVVDQQSISEILDAIHSSSLIRLTREDLQILPDAVTAAKASLKRINARLGKVIGAHGHYRSPVFKQLIGTTTVLDDVMPYAGLFAISGQISAILNADSENKANEAFARLTEESNRWLLESEKEIAHARLKHLDSILPGEFAFKLYDTFGFPLDMTQLLAMEHGLTIDVAEFNRLMTEQRERARSAQKRQIIVAATEGGDQPNYEPTEFTGYDIENLSNFDATIVDFFRSGNDYFLVFDRSPFYAEMGGQTGDMGRATIQGNSLMIVDTTRDKYGRYLHKVSRESEIGIVSEGTPAILDVDVLRRRAISRHHSAAHLIHWALRKVLGTHVRQAGTSKTAERMRFDFSHFEAMTPGQLKEVECLVNEKVIDNAPVSAYETEFDRKPEGTLAFFGDKYGKIVRVVDIGGYSRELCGGTHVTTTGEIGLIRIMGESGIAAGTRRIEAVAGQAAFDFVAQREAALAAVGSLLSAGPNDVARKLETLLAHQKDLEKKLRAIEQKASAALATELAAAAIDKNGLKFVSAAVSVSEPEALRSLGSQIMGRLGEGVVTLGAAFGEKTSLVAFCSPAAIKAGFQAGKLVAELSARLGGKGGGKPDFAMGGGKEPGRLDEVLKL